MSDLKEAVDVECSVDLDVGAVAATPGRLLSTAREKKGWTLADVAQKLNLNADFLRAIERDSNEGLPPRSFTHGYLRAYAKLLGVDSAVVMPLWEQLNPPQTEERMVDLTADLPMKKFSKRQMMVRRGRGKRLKQLLLWILVFLVAVGSLTYLYHNHNPSQQAVTVLAPEVSTSGSAPILLRPLQAPVTNQEGVSVG